MPRLFVRPYTNSIRFYQGGVVSSLLKTNPVGINTGTGNVTVTGWIYLTSDIFGTMCTLETATNNTRAMGFGQLAGIYYVFSDGVSVNVTITKFAFESRIGVNKWRRVAISTNGTNIDIWVDGVLLQSTTMTINTGALTRLLFGKRLIGGIDTQPFQGYMKDMQIYNNYFTLADAETDYYDARNPYTPVSSFLMEEGSGTTIADQVGSNALTAASINWSTFFLPMSARTQLTNVNRLVRRNIPSCIDVITNAGVLVNNAVSLNPTDYVVLEAWAKPVPGFNLVLFDNSTVGVTSSYLLLIASDGSLFWYSTIGGIGRNILGVGAKLALNQWHFISATYDGANITLMADGNVISTLAATGALGTNNGQLRIGTYFNTGVPNQGWVTQPRIYHRNDYTINTHRARYFYGTDDANMRSTLVLDMPMAEAGGTVVNDISGLGNHGTFSRAVWNSITPLQDTVRIRTQGTGSLKLDGTTQWVDLGNTGAIAAATAAFSLSCWFKRDKNLGIVAMVGDNDNTAQRHFNFQTQGAGRKLLTTLITSVGAKPLVGLNNIPANVWVHAVLTYDGAFIRWYYNGLPDSFTTHTGTVLASASGMLIGTGSAPIGQAYRIFSGNIQDVKYWDRAITAPEVYDMYFLGRNDAALRIGLKGEWLLYANALDTSGFGNHGTLIGSPVFDANEVPFKDRVLIV